MLWPILTACFYCLFTLAPDSHSLMVQWPWVAFWQMGLLFPIFWLLSQIWHQRRLQPLGNGLDAVAGLVVFSIIVAVIGARFPHQARWYGWAALGVIAALYALHQWLLTPNDSSILNRRLDLLTKQGYLNLAFIFISLTLWLTQTVLPELQRLKGLKVYGVNLPFDFSVLELRNWAPIGHQNYVAGYLLLALPLLIGLGILESGNRRWLWWSGAFLTILNLYSTSSRGGLLGLAGLLLVGLVFLVLKTRVSRLWLALGGLGSLALLGLYIQTNNRLKSLIIGLFNGQGDGELAFRRVNAIISWKMGSEHPFSGVGLGGVPLVYQQYHPFWAGRTSELVYQLHSTPGQLFAEMGIWGILSLIIGSVWVVWLLLRHDWQKSPDDLLMGCIAAGLFAYALMSLTDYQLDNLSISGTIVIYLACLAAFLGQDKVTSLEKVPPLGVVYTGLGIVLAMIIWLLPIHRAWQLSSQGFLALANDKIEPFVTFLNKAQKTVSWEPYYPYQLGWNLGNLAINTKNSQLLPSAVEGFERGNKISPYQEFGYSNLAWLLLQRNPQQAQVNFIKAIELMPAKTGNFYGLGLSLLAQNRGELGVESFTLEALRDPALITSPLWRLPNLQILQAQILKRLNIFYSSFLQNPTLKPSLVSYLHQCRGAINWWQGNLEQAHLDWDTYGTPVSQKLLSLSTNKAQENVLSPAFNSLLQAWENPSQRVNLLNKAWVQATAMALPKELEEKFLASMEQSKNFTDWLKNLAPVSQYRRQRAGFGVLSRHIDGPQPVDFFPIVENLAVKTWLTEVFPATDYDPPLDELLQPLREKFLASLKK